MTDAIERPDQSVTARPHPALRDYLRAYHGYRYRVGEPNIHYGLPSTSLTVVIALGAPIDVGWLGDESSRGRHHAMVSGLAVSPAAIYQVGVQEGIQLDLTPRGVRAIFGLPAAPLRDVLASFDDLLGVSGEQVYDAVSARPDWSGRFAALDRELLRIVDTSARRTSGIDPTLHTSWELIHTANGVDPIGAVADRVGWSRRHLTHRFRSEFGITPKQAARLVRFARARGRLLAGERLADVAHRSGYADQAHFTRDWHQLAGLPPTAWIAEERPFVQDHESAG